MTPNPRRTSLTINCQTHRRYLAPSDLIALNETNLLLCICVLSAGTAMSSPQSEVDNCGAVLDDKEDSYFNEIKNFISNTGQNQMSPGSSEEG